MRKKIATIVVILAVILLSAGFYYLQFGRNMDVVNSMSLNSANYRQERLTVVMNKMIITNSYEETANAIIQHVLDNDFHTIRFSFDKGYPHELGVSVYRTESDLESGNMLFSFSYGQVSGETGQYDISQSDYMSLEISD